MKSVKFAILLGLALSATPSLAGDSSSGCGLGWQLLTKNSLLSSFSRSVTHAFLPNSFSMTFGTSGCAKHSIVMRDKRSLHFVEANMDQIQGQAAQGQGAYLEALAQTMGCAADVTPHFGASLQAHYSYVFNAAPLAPGEVLSHMKDVVGATPELAFACPGAA